MCSNPEHQKEFEKIAIQMSSANDKLTQTNDKLIEISTMLTTVVANSTDHEQRLRTIENTISKNTVNLRLIIGIVSVIGVAVLGMITDFIKGMGK